MQVFFRELQLGSRHVALIKAQAAGFVQFIYLMLTLEIASFRSLFELGSLHAEHYWPGALTGRLFQQAASQPLALFADYQPGEG